ncbi:MAG: TonB-dependent receptor plug domain-containing protein [Pseudomonadota bacterium]
MILSTQKDLTLTKLRRGYSFVPLLVVPYFLVVVCSFANASGVREVFEPQAFERFAPRTALDMARQVPGFPIDEGESERGFGQADTNILLNGRRISGKSNGPVDALGRIPAEDVVRLEVLDGASLDIGGLSGQVLNVVTATGGGITGQFRYSPEGRTDDAPFRWGNGSVAISGGSDTTEWTLNVVSNQSSSGTEGPERVTDGAGALIDLREERAEEFIDQPGVAGSLTRVWESGEVLNLSAEVNWFIYDFEELSSRNPVGGIAQTRELVETEDEFNFELGADYEFGLRDGRLKFIALHRYEDSPTEARVRFDFVDESAPAGTVFKRRAEEAETVLRGEYTHKALGGDWQWAAEGTHNYLDIDGELQVRDESGLLVPAELPGASSRVEEDRAELTVSYSQTLTERLQLQYSVGGEYSEIRQTGSGGQIRDFIRPKGFVSANWAPSDALDVSLQLERQVGQLRFFDFISSVNINQERVNVSNVDLVPPQSWILSLQAQRSLGDLGSLTLSANFEDITDIVDQIPIEGGGQAPGNLDAAERWSVSTNVTLLLDPIGWQGLRLDADASYTDSEVADPLTGEVRPITDDDYLDFEVTIRQDFSGSPWAAGLELSYRKNRPSIRLDETSLFRPTRAFSRLFIENKDVWGMTLRGSLSNLNDRGLDFSRTIFADRLTDTVDFREDRLRDFGLLIGLDIEGSF